MPSTAQMGPTGSQTSPGPATPPPEPDAETLAGQRRILPALSPTIDPERYAHTAKAMIRGFDKDLAADAVVSARRLWCQTMPGSAFADLDAVRTVARYLAREAVRTGTFSYKAAFRRANVDAYINTVSTRQTSRSARKIQSQLHDAGRLLYPREYPARRSLAAPHVRRIPAASAEQVRDWYALAPTLSPALSRRLYTVLDLCHGVGARPPDFKVLTGTSITEATWDNEPVAVVRLPNRAGGTRLVPAADAEVSQRLLKLAETCGPGFLLTTETGEVERNVTNRVAEKLRKHGHRSPNAAALRNRWLLDLATRIPAALMLQLADVTTAQILADQRDQLPDYSLQHTIALTKEL
ncbi:hypothetical protein H7J77_14045 [Mycolicibacillus parakoreensis]|uniref:Integrase n=1 Tax=Mycolicibacillus parakoreensis TaxID=1069221 RepID=A0ABY3U2H2_9MYCO|nr:hypothetical protein [Mycolicibacillus parakoreensis]MCV7316656.1 hypothetical protein [Mycolicibacillus parakoreensis]ULN52866.1 hypothetical protein MIU77_00225 [Mycolicibacillus parakoreensis]